jgi:hypothetical protein
MSLRTYQKKNNILLIFLSTILLFLITGCGSKTGGSSTASGTKQESTTKNTTTTASTSSAVTATSAPVPSVTITSPLQTPYYSKTPNLIISGLCSGSNIVNLSGSSTDSVICATNAYSFNISVTNDGTFNYSILQTDGNLSSSATTFQWILDRVAPLAPTITSPLVNPFISSASSLNITGACEEGATLTLSGDIVASDASTPANSLTQTCTGAVYSYTLNKTADGTYNLSLLQTDKAGNSSIPTSLVWTKNTIIPSAPVITSPLQNPYYSKTPNLIISGLCSGSNIVNLSGGSIDLVMCATNTYSFNVSATNDGTFNYSMVQTNGDLSSSTTTFQWILDRVAPLAPTITSPLSNPFISSASSLNITGTCEEGATLTLSGDIVASDVSTPANSLTQICTGAVYSYTLNKTADGAYNLSLLQTDKAANASNATSLIWTKNATTPVAPVITSPGTSPFYSAGSSFSIVGTCTTDNTVELTGADTQSTTCVSSSFNFTISKVVDNNYSFVLHQVSLTDVSSSSIGVSWIRDTIVAAPTVTAPSSSGMYTSADSSITIQGNCEIGAIVTLGGNGSGTTTCSNSGTYSFTYAKSVDDTYALILSQTDLAGNVSSNTSFTWTRNSLAPVNPVIESPVSTPYYSNGSSLILTGSCVNGNSVSLDGADTQIFTCDTNNSFTFTVNNSTDGTYTYTISQADALTFVASGQTYFTWNRYTTTPLAINYSVPAQSPYSSSGNSLTISGFCEANLTITISGSNNSTQTCGTDGTFTFSDTQTTDASYTYTLIQTDLAGNSSSSTSVQWNRNSSMPNTPIIISPSATPTYSSNSTVTISGSCTPGLTVSLAGVSASDVSAPEASLTQTCDATLGSFSYTLSIINDNTYNLSVKQTSLTNVNSANANVSWIRDTVAPVASFTSNPNSTNYASTASFAFSSNESGSSFVCSTDNTTFATCTSPYVLTYTNTQNGSKTFYIKAIDKTGNTSVGVSYTWTQAYYYTIGLYHVEAGGTDSGSYGNTLTAVGSPTFAAGKITNGVTLATAKFLYAANTATQSLSNSVMTVEAWVKYTTNPASTTKPLVIVSKSANSITANLGWIFGAIKGSSTTKQKMVFWGSLNGTTFTKITATTSNTIATGTWYHLAMTFNKGTVTFYFNGVSSGTGTIGTAGSSVLYSSTADLSLGANSTAGTAGTTAANYLTGALDEVRISQNLRYSNAFTPSISAFTGD